MPVTILLASRVSIGRVSRRHHAPFLHDRCARLCCGRMRGEPTEPSRATTTLPTAPWHQCAAGQCYTRCRRFPANHRTGNDVWRRSVYCHRTRWSVRVVTDGFHHSPASIVVRDRGCTRGGTNSRHRALVDRSQLRRSSRTHRLASVTDVLPNKRLQQTPRTLAVGRRVLSPRRPTMIRGAAEPHVR